MASPLSISLAPRTTGWMLAIVAVVAVADLMVDAASSGDFRLSVLGVVGAATVLLACRLSLVGAPALLTVGVLLVNTTLEDGTLLDVAVVLRQHAQACPDDLLVIDENNPDHASSLSGSDA